MSPLLFRLDNYAQSGQSIYIHDTVVADNSYQWDLASHQIFSFVLVLFCNFLKTALLQMVRGYDLMNIVSQTDLFFATMIHNFHTLNLHIHCRKGLVDPTNGLLINTLYDVLIQHMSLLGIVRVTM